MHKQELINNILTTLPSMMKKLMGQVYCADMPKQQMLLLHAIRHHDNMPMRFYSEHTQISKPNLTVLADKLIELGYVDRYSEPGDRRMIRLKITDAGRMHMEDAMKRIMENAMKKFEKVEDEKLARLSAIVTEMNEIIKEMDNSLEE